MAPWLDAHPFCICQDSIQVQNFIILPCHHVKRNVLECSYDERKDTGKFMHHCITDQSVVTCQGQVAVSLFPKCKTQRRIKL